VFRLTPRGVETVLYSFCAQTNCADGANPGAALIMDEAENLYGTTPVGGANDRGTVFELTPGGRETVLYSFCAQTNCTDGATPTAGLIMDKAGNLYGTTFHGGGTSDDGTVFVLTHRGTETVLYSFCAQTDCGDGALPQAGLIMDKAGNLYGTTVQGGANNFLGGVVFQLTP